MVQFLVDICLWIFYNNFFQIIGNIKVNSNHYKEATLPLKCRKDPKLYQIIQRWQGMRMHKEGEILLLHWNVKNIAIIYWQFCHFASHYSIFTNLNLTYKLFINNCLSYHNYYISEHLFLFYKYALDLTFFKSSLIE